MREHASRQSCKVVDSAPVTPSVLMKTQRTHVHFSLVIQNANTHTRTQCAGYSLVHLLPCTAFKKRQRLHKHAHSNLVNLNAQTHARNVQACRWCTSSPALPLNKKRQSIFTPSNYVIKTRKHTHAMRRLFAGAPSPPHCFLAAGWGPPPNDPTQPYQTLKKSEYVCVCLYVCMCARTYVCMCVNLCACMCVCVCV